MKGMRNLVPHHERPVIPVSRKKWCSKVVYRLLLAELMVLPQYEPGAIVIAERAHATRAMSPSASLIVSSPWFFLALFLLSFKDFPFISLAISLSFFVFLFRKLRNAERGKKCLTPRVPSSCSGHRNPSIEVRLQGL